MSPPPSPTADYRARIKTDTDTAQHYLQRRPAKDRGELELVARAFRCIPADSSVLDIPCGAGRVAILLARRGYRCTGADLGPGILDLARQEIAAAGVACALDSEDIERMSYPDRAFDAVVCFRLFHHFPAAAVRARVVAELCRVADRHVALSYLSPRSVTAWKRRLRAALGGKRSRQHHTPLSEVQAYFAPHGFSLLRDHCQSRLHSLHLAVFERSAKS